MKLASIWFDDVVTIALGKSNGDGEPRANLQELSFHERDGWDIRETLPGTFSLLCDGMPKPVTIGGYGYTYVSAEEPPVVEKVGDTTFVLGPSASADRRRDRSKR